MARTMAHSLAALSPHILSTYFVVHLFGLVSCDENEKECERQEAGRETERLLDRWGEWYSQWDREVACQKKSVGKEFKCQCTRFHEITSLERGWCLDGAIEELFGRIRLLLDFHSTGLPGKIG
mmetsp:Transcript_1544/g.5313  ORF Transcript_1544/g.5313 Transcript_1544/m.5313 type:complete len:123 (+) Transcript_1544:118-486(+)